MTCVDRWAFRASSTAGSTSGSKTSSVDRPGDYCVGGKLHVRMPRVVVDGVGDLSFPVPHAQVEALIGAAERAPYSKGTRTLVDTSVRDCWQIDAGNVRLLGRVWPDSLAQIMEIVADGLGLPAEGLGVELYKLLVYQPGGFFDEHRDTEKVPGMVATLSLSLPTAGAGGEIVVRHGGRETTFDMKAVEPSELAFAAFYADCLHEVLPVTEGRRLSLVFSLVLDSTAGGLAAPDYTDLIAPVAECLTEWRDEGGADKLVWLLEHEYSEVGLSFETLKNTDAAVAKLLGAAADRADCDLHAAVLRIEEYGTPEFYFGDSYWADGEEDVDATMADVPERFESLDAWTARDGSQPPFGQIPVNDSELLPLDALADAEPDDRRLEGSTGNEGPTLEHIYRLAALVVWPRDKTVDIVAGAGIDGALAWAATRITGESGNEGDSDRRILSKLIELWPVGGEYRRERDRGAMLRLLAAADAADLAVDFLRRAVMAEYDGSENEAFAEVMPLIGAEEAGEFLVGLVEKQLPERPGCVVDLLVLAGEVADLTDDVAWRDVLRESVVTALTGLEAALHREVKARADEDARRSLQFDLDLIRTRLWAGIDEEAGEDPAREWIDHEAVRDLFLLARPLGLADESMAAARAIGDHPKIVTPGRMLPAALEGMHEDEALARSPAYALLSRKAADFLLGRSSDVPSEPNDWKMTVEIPCDCEDCSRLRAFCRDPEKQVGRFSVRKDRRKHLHRTIDGYGLDIDHVTERRGSPFTLVCTKNRKGYRRRLAEYAEDLRWMDSLRLCAPRGEGGAVSSESVARLVKAVATGKATGAGAPS